MKQIYDKNGNLLGTFLEQGEGANYTAGTGIDITNNVISCTASGKNYVIPHYVIFTRECLGYEDGSDAQIPSAKAIKNWLELCGFDLESEFISGETADHLAILVGPEISYDSGTPLDKQAIFKLTTEVTSGEVIKAFQFEFNLYVNGTRLSSVTVPLATYTLGEIIDILMDNENTEIIDLMSFFDDLSGTMYANLNVIYRSNIRDTEIISEDVNIDFFKTDVLSEYQTSESSS